MSCQYMFWRYIFRAAFSRDRPAVIKIVGEVSDLNASCRALFQLFNLVFFGVNTNVSILCIISLYFIVWVTKLSVLSIL